jgi:hypothetical protein
MADSVGYFLGWIDGCDLPPGYSGRITGARFVGLVGQDHLGLGTFPGSYFSAYSYWLSALRPLHLNHLG